MNKSEIAKVQTLGSAKLTVESPVTKKVEFADCVDPEEVTYNELPHLDLRCLLSSF